jgi:uncharacterized phage infection (PIP) family protein YhgE
MAEVDGGDIVIRIRGDASDLEDAVTRSQGAISGLESGAGDAADVLGDMGSAAKKTKVDLKSMSGEGIGAVAAGLSTVNPQAGALVGLFGQLRMLSGPLAIALGVVTAAFAVYKHEVDKAADAAERAKEQIEAFNDAFEEQAVIAGDLRSELRLINGEIDKDGLAHEKRKTRIQAAGDAVVAALDEQIEAQEQLIDSTGRNSRVSVEQQAEMAKLKDELTRLNQERADAVDATESQIDAADAIAEFYRESKDAADDLADAQGGLSDGIDKVTSSLQDQLDVLDDYNQSIETGIGGSAPAGIDALVGRINDLTRSEEELLSSSEKLKLEQSALDVEFARGNISLEQYDTLTGQVAGKQAELSEQTRGVEDAAKASEKALKLKGVQESLEATAELSGMLAEKLGEDSKKAALTMFRISKAAGLASIAISTAVGISKTIEEYGMTPIGIAASVGVGLLGAAQAATVAATPAPAHMGDPLAPDERRVSGRRVLATEAVLDSATTRRMGGEDGLREAMRGGGSSQPVQVNLTYKHLDREVARLMRSNSRTRRAVRS